MTSLNRSATIRVRLKGAADGPVYQGQQLVKACRTCGGKPAGIAMPDRSSAEQRELALKRHMEALAAIAPAGSRMAQVRYDAPPEPRPAGARPVRDPQLTLEPVPGLDPAQIEIHTLRYGELPWLRECAATLDQWCERHGLALRVWGHPGEVYPSAKFCEIDMLREFLAGDREWMMYLDADVYLHPLAPVPRLEQPGFHILRDQPTKLQKRFHEWTRRHYGAEFRGWVYRNAGVWACDREAAAKMLEVIRPPYLAGCQEQHQWNYWLLRAQEAGLEIHELPPEWNHWPHDSAPGWAFHLAGARKERKLARLRERRLLPRPPESYRKTEHAETPRAIVYPWRAESAAWEELRYSLRSMQEHFEDKECPIYLLAAAPPPWLREGGRVKFIPAPSYMRAISAGVQSAAEVLWMNDDIALLQPCGWEDFRMPRHVGEMTRKQQEDWHWDANTWKQGVSRAITDLTHRGRTRYNCETHTPYVWQRDRALEVLETYGLWHKIPLATLYANHHRLEMLPLAGFRTSDPAAVDAPVLNYVDRLITPGFIATLEARFPQAAAWEKGGEVER